MSRKGSVREAIRQEKPLRSRRQEAFLALLLAAEEVRARFERHFATEDGLTAQQYNVLRILRGAGAQGLPTLDIGERMIERTPGVTRLIDRLAKKKLVERERSSEDKRQVWCSLTPRGRQLLTRFDAPIDALEDEVFGCFDPKELRSFIELADKLRNHQP
ncbi:MAG: MarR family transcriptional regulator [Planctomycetes bacterium]|nr:MarR family transcriptional regulator [Planctomycetota bacterium]